MTTHARRLEARVRALLSTSTDPAVAAALIEIAKAVEELSAEVDSLD